MTWTRDPDGLLVAVRSARSRREAIEVVATWRAVPRPPPAPEPAFEDEVREDTGPVVSPAVGARLVPDGIAKAPPMGTIVPRGRGR